MLGFAEAEVEEGEEDEDRDCSEDEGGPVAIDGGSPGVSSPVVANVSTLVELSSRS